jgi:hypothetical protein
MSCRSLLFLLCFVLIYGARSGEAKPKDSAGSMFQSPKIQLPKGTTVKLRFVRPISSASARVGDHVDLEVAEDVKIDGTVIVPGGGKAEGFVAQAMPGKFWGAGSLSVYVGSVVTRTGFRLPVHGSMTASATPGGVTDNASKEVTIPEGVEVTASTDIDIPLEAALYREADLSATN